MSILLRRLAFAAVVATVLGAALPAQAIPPFARRYGMACPTCHVGGPTKLSTFGEAFRDNGYRIPGETESYLRDPQMQLGHPNRAALFPRTVWPGEIPGTLPLGASGLVQGVVNLPRSEDGAKPTTQVNATASLLLGGSLGAHLSVFGRMSVSNAGFELNQIFLVARSLFDKWIPEAAINLKVGRMNLDLFAVQPNLYRSALQPMAYEMAIGRDGFTLRDPGEAIEFYGLVKGRFKWMVGGANGKKPIDDFTSRRDFIARLQLKLGGSRLDMADADSGEDATSFGIGAATYVGVGVVSPNPPEPRFSSDIYRVLVDLRLRTHKLDVLGQVTLGQDSDPDGLGEQVRHLAWHVHIDYPILPWLQPLVRYEEAYFDSDRHPLRRRLVVGLQAFIRANLRLRAEGAAGLSPTEPHVLVGDLFFAL